MNEQTTEQPSLTRRVTDAALVIIAVAAIASWLWRRLRPPSTGDTAALTHHDKVDEAVVLPADNTPV